jgi:hypothetical protein
MNALGLALLATPFAFGVIRLLTTGSDWRYLPVAVASTLGAVAVRYVRGAALQLVAGMVTSVAMAALASWLVGARNVVSMGIVGISFALCSVLGAFLQALATKEPK